MKKHLFLGAIALLFSSAVFAQIRIGALAGLSTQINTPNGLQITLNDTVRTLSFGDKKFGTQLGGFVHIGIGGFFIRPEVVFNSSSQNFNVESPAGVLTKSESYKYLDLPVMVGFGGGILHFQGGPVGHYYLSSSSELTQFKEYKTKFEALTWGWQAGINIGSDQFSFDIRYEGNFGKLGEHIVASGSSVKFDKSPARIIAAVHLALF